MSLPVVQIHLLTVDYDTRAVITRWCVADYFDTTYDPNDGEGPQDWITYVGDQKVRVLLDGVPATWYSLENGVKDIVQGADAILLINRPGDAKVSEAMVNLRNGPFQEHVQAQAKQPLEVVVDLWWDTMPHGGTATEDSEDLADRIGGPKAQVCCARTGEGIQDAVRDVVARVLDRRADERLHQGGKAQDNDHIGNEGQSQLKKSRAGWRNILSKLR